jgi:hypothetical protein
MDNPAESLTVARDSLRCFACGWISLIPVLGLPFATTAIRLHLRVRKHYPDVWNPGRRYLAVGFPLACMGLLVSVVALGALIVGLAHRFL